MGVHLGPAALLAQQVGVVVRLLPLLLVRVSPHQLPVAHVVDLLPLLLAADTLLVLGPGLKHTPAALNQSDCDHKATGSCGSRSYLLKMSSQCGDAGRVEQNDGALKEEEQDSGQALQDPTWRRVGVCWLTLGYLCRYGSSRASASTRFPSAVPDATQHGQPRGRPRDERRACVFLPSIRDT